MLSHYSPPTHTLVSRFSFSAQSPPLVATTPSIPSNSSSDEREPPPVQPLRFSPTRCSLLPPTEISTSTEVPYTSVSLITPCLAGLSVCSPHCSCWSRRASRTLSCLCLPSLFPPGAPSQHRAWHGIIHFEIGGKQKRWSKETELRACF